jgi:hypothetical protein
MKKWIIAALALMLAANAPALAQNGRNKPPATDTMGGRPLPEAPVGHRQPRVGDVPDERNLSSSDQMAKEDAALDRKIKSICRGC